MILVLYWLIFIAPYSFLITVLFMSSLPIYIIISCTHCLYERAPSFFSYTLTGSLSNDPEFTHPDIRCFIFINQVFNEKITRFTRSWSSLTWSLFLGIILLVFIHTVSMILCIGFILVLFHFLFHLRSCVDIICIIAVILIYHGRFYNLFRLL